MSQKSIRDMDAILIRVPDGMKDRLSQRAKANGRSLSAELVAILTKVLDAPDELDLRRLEVERAALAREEDEAKERLNAIQVRAMALNDEIMKRRSEFRRAIRDAAAHAKHQSSD